MILLTLDELLHIAERALGAPAIVRDVGLLESAIARPATTLFGNDAYPSLETKAAALVHSIVRNHALIDGNKRLGLAALLVFLGVNGRHSTWSNDEAYEFIIEIAEGRLDDIGSIERQIAGALERQEG